MTHKVISKIRLNELAGRYFPKPGSNRGFAPHTYILSLVMMFHEGGSALSHIQRIQQDMALRTLFDLRFVPGEDALRKWLHQHKAYGVQALTEINCHLLRMTLKDQREVTLDIDATFIKSHKQEAQWAYLKSKGYMPIVAHIAETGQVAAADFREGNVAPATGNFEFLQACEAALPHGVKVSRFRSDAAAYQHRILDHCIDEGMNFTVRASMSTAVRKRIPAEDDPRWQPMIGRDGQIVEGEMTCRIIHAMEGSKQPFTLIIKRQAIEGQLSFDLDDDDTTTVQQGQFTYRAIATNLDDWQDHEIIHWYNQRGEHAENRIKELR